MFKTRIEFIFIIFIICLAYLNLNGFTDDSLYMFIVGLMILIFYYKNNEFINGVSVFLIGERERNIANLVSIFSEKNIILLSLINNETNILTSEYSDFIKNFNEYIFTYYSLVSSNLNELHTVILIKNRINVIIANINK